MKVRILLVGLVIFLSGCATAPKNVQPSFVYAQGETDIQKLSLLRGTFHKGNFIRMAERSGVCGVDGNKEQAYYHAYIAPGKHKVCLRATPYGLNAPMSMLNDEYVEYEFEAGKTYDVNFRNKFTRYVFTIDEASK